MQLHQRQSSSLSIKSISTPGIQHSFQPMNPLSTSITTMSERIINLSSALFINRSFVSSSVLLSIIAWSVTILLISSCLEVAEATKTSSFSHQLGKRSYLDLGCKGVYDKSIFARLDRVCEDCYNLFREPQLHTLCRRNCFKTDFFDSCIKVLLLDDESEKYEEMREYLGRRK